MAKGKKTRKLPKGDGQFKNRLYSMDNEALAKIQVVHDATGDSFSKIVRDAIKAYAPNPELLKAHAATLTSQAAELQAMASKKAPAHA